MAAADVPLREIVGRLKSRVDLFIGGGSSSGGINIPGGVLGFASIPALISQTREDIGFALCVGAWIEYDGNLSLWLNLGELIPSTPRIPNGTSIIATAGGLWLWKIHIEEFFGEETIVIPPGGMPFTASYTLDFDSIDDAKVAPYNTKRNNIIADAQGNPATFIRVSSIPEGTVDLDYYINSGGFIFKRIA